MNQPMRYVGHRVIVLGFGIEGVSAAGYFLKHGAHVTVYDKRELPVVDPARKNLEKQGVSFVWGTIPQLTEFTIVIRSPGIRPDDPAIMVAQSRGVTVTSATKEFLASCPAKVVGVTATKGKGTIASLIAEMLRIDGKRVFLGGNIGIYPLDFLDDISKEDWVVLELSSFQLFDVSQSPHIAVVGMVTVDHLDYHVDTREYLHAKATIVQYQKSTDFAVINIDSKNSRELREKATGSVIQVSRSEKYVPGCYLRDDRIWYADFHGETEIIKGSEIFIPGRHNWENACAATAAAMIAGASLGSIRTALRTFRGLEHRLEFVKEARGVRYYDDSFSTTPETAIAAIQAFSEPKIIILGGSSKQSDFADLADELRRNSTIRMVIGIGREWSRIQEALDRAPHTVHIVKGAQSMETIVSSAASHAKPGDVVLLSPACASFDMFKNYKERGNQFKAEVMKLED